MARTTIVFGVLLLALGVVGYLATSAPTALIPAAFGAVFVVAGAVAMNDRYRAHAMHAVSLLGAIGFLASARGLFQLPVLLMGGAVARPAAVWAQSIMAVLMAIFVYLCFQSFLEARRRRALKG